MTKYYTRRNTIALQFDFNYTTTLSFDKGGDRSSSNIYRLILEWTIQYFGGVVIMRFIKFDNFKSMIMTIIKFLLQN